MQELPQLVQAGLDHGPSHAHVRGDGRLSLWSESRDQGSQCDQAHGVTQERVGLKSPNEQRCLYCSEKAVFLSLVMDILPSLCDTPIAFRGATVAAR
jgi:hypothetical protein